MSSALHEAAELCESLKRWLLDDAYPMWWTRGADRERGGFHERLHQDGRATDEPRRARLHPRQMFAYNQAGDLGWDGAHEEAVQHGLDFFLARYRRPDRLYRTLVAPDGSVLDDRVVLYDQAFALLGLAAAYDTLDDDALRDCARDLHEQLRVHLQNPVGGFEESNPRVLPLSSNSHMHLLEACLAWMDLDHDARWQAAANEIVELALLHFIDPVTGLLREFFDGEWRPVAGDEGRIVEPGHQFEWGWLLLRWVERTGEIRAREPALRMIQFGESLGVDTQRGVAITSLLSDGSVRDPLARLWPQTERIKAACIAAETTRQPEYWTMAAAAARGLLKYLDTPLRGLWRDKLNVDGTFVDEPAPASSFYHIVCAISELEHTLKRVL
jgi:mannose-6-phosphate isomerase